MPRREVARSVLLVPHQWWLDQSLLTGRVRDSPLPLKRRGFSLNSSYAGMRSEPYPRGRSHNANYWAGTQILSPDVDRAHPVSVPDEATAFVGTAEDSPSHLAAHMSAFGTCARGIRFFLEHNFHALPLGFVGKFEAH